MTDEAINYSKTISSTFVINHCLYATSFIIVSYQHTSVSINSNNWLIDFIDYVHLLVITCTTATVSTNVKNN